MLKVDRSTVSKPKVLSDNAETWREELLLAYDKMIKAITGSNAKYVAARRSYEKIQQKYRHTEVKTQIIALFRGKCAYCESKINHVDYGHIEHYRPKETFHDLTFEWENLLLSCAMCNGPLFKGNKFPQTPADEPILNPCADDPCGHFSFVYDATTQLASVYGITDRGSMSEALMGLNRYELRQYRSKWIKFILFLASRASVDPDAEKLLAEAASDDGEYVGFVRALLANMPI